MEVINDVSLIKNISNSVVTIGNFDGIHNGHRVLIENTVNYAKKHDIKSIVFTFSNHPINYFKPNSIKNILTNDEKLNLFKNMGVDIVLNIKFDDYMTNIEPYFFVRDILYKKLNAKKIIIGYDFRFGKNKQGSPNTLLDLSKEFGFLVDVVDEIEIDKKRISSTYIRTLIEDGRVDEIKKYLGRNYFLSGEVIHARKLGRTIGFPTANIKIQEDILIPKRGIYASKVYIDESIYFGATNIGYNPTVSGDKLSIETHILNFNEDIYGKVIKVEFIERIRDEKKFDSIDELKEQLKKDTSYVENKYLKNSSIIQNYML